MVSGWAVLDGFDFGAGMLHRFVARTDTERRTVLSSIGPVWDGNEVWLLAAGGTLFLAFPSVVAAGFSGLYLPIIVMVWALMMRGLSIELRSHVGNPLWRDFFDMLFTVSSFGVPVCAGMALGNVVRGVPIDETGWFTLELFTNLSLSPPYGVIDLYTLACGALVASTLAAHGAHWLVWKTEGPVQERARTVQRPLWVATVVLWLVCTWGTAAVNASVFAALRTRPLAWALFPVVAAGAACVFLGQARRSERLAFAGSSAFIVGLLALTAACVYPVMLRSTLQESFSLTALNALSPGAGPGSGTVWFLPALLLAVGYFLFILRLHPGKAKAGPEH